ncbi:hypothetical protein IID24_02235 [Patescibacteria group bacterium]|nr:hypothetical protein [Patescibacteria group bacterium]
MKFEVQLGRNNIITAMRKCGYVPSGQDEKTGKLRFYRPIRNGRYPRFHIYCSLTDGTATLNLHLDQKQPSYTGTPAHGGEYDSLLVETETERIKDLLS